jgi:hypothetical protein
MKFLNRSECSSWLKSQQCPDSPYGRPLLTTANYLQFAVPRNQGVASRIVQEIRTYINTSQGCLFQVTDWSRLEDELKTPILASLESTRSGELPQFEAVGILFETVEVDTLIDCCLAVIECGMSAYLYAPQVATFYLWEGDLVDFWSEDAELHNQFTRWLVAEHLSITSSYTPNYSHSMAAFKNDL